ncbi:hypothetical protein BV25DRAFT_1920811 [Artomyces pyxidatus]|uniref:Uncharacterized protein n=1 Tax=Artomyces pyxidatus TaxID=48021 RepID=A0ACB8SJQ7_9AGAM|nr:hypothetical protein BV25DRAFT_1920811 [Artomyces pyxidatus]
MIADALTDVWLREGDFIGEGLPFHGYPLRTANLAASQRDNLPAERLQVVHPIGAGTHLLLYRAREVPPLALEPATKSPPNYVREFVVKVFSKAYLSSAPTRDRMSILSEIHAHQSLPPHQNIVALLRTYENAAAIILVLEHLPGENKVMQLLPDSIFQAYGPSTVRTPSFLSQNSHTRIVASVFAQMCDAVAVCHDAGIYLRDLQATNFFVTFSSPVAHDDAEINVVVQLQDFEHCISGGTDPVVTASDIGPGIYRPDVARARAADVSSLGQILTSMLSGRIAINQSLDGRVCLSGISDIFIAFLERHSVGDSMHTFGAPNLSAWAWDIVQLMDAPPPYELHDPSISDTNDLSIVQEEPPPWSPGDGTSLADLRAHPQDDCSEGSCIGSPSSPACGVDCPPFAPVFRPDSCGRPAGRCGLACDGQCPRHPYLTPRSRAGLLDLQDVGCGRCRDVLPPPTRARRLSLAAAPTVRILITRAARAFLHKPRDGADARGPALVPPDPAGSSASAASSAVSVTTRSSCKSRKNVYTAPPGRAFLR